MKCHLCGFEFIVPSRTCPACGRTINFTWGTPAPGTFLAKPAAPPRKSQTRPNTGKIVGGIVAAAVIGLFALGGFSPFTPCNDCGAIFTVHRYEKTTSTYSGRTIGGPVGVYLCDKCADSYPRRNGY